ncbi:MAG TPA: SDR family oxidoreductase, partial [Polyangiaceae bacterium]
VREKLAPDAEAALDMLPLEQRRRVNVIEGDAAWMDLGLSGAEFRSLTREVDRIHHCARVSYLGADRASVEHTNVNGAREILEFAEACHDLKSLVFHSSTSVSGDRTGLVREDELDKGQKLRNVVEETSLRAEQMMRAAMKKIPIVVVRPSMVVGDSLTGEVDRFDGPYLLILLLLTAPPDVALPLPGKGDVQLHLVPADYVAKAAHAIGKDPRAPGRTFHLVDPNPLTARRVFELFARAGGRRMPRGSIPANFTKALLKTPGIDRFVKSPRAFLETLTTPVSYATSQTDTILGGSGIVCPPFETYVDKLVEFVQDKMREKRLRAERDEHDPLSQQSKIDEL